MHPQRRQATWGRGGGCILGPTSGSSKKARSAAVSAFPEDLIDHVDQVVPVDGIAQLAGQRRHAVRVEVLVELGGCESAAEHGSVAVS